MYFPFHVSHLVINALFSHTQQLTWHVTNNMEYWCTHCRTHWKAPGGSSTLHKGTTTYLNASTIIRPLKLCMPMNFLRTSMLNSLLWNMRGRVNLNTYIGIVLTMKSYKLVSCCWRQRQNTVHTLSTSVFQKSVLFGFSTKSFEWQTHQVWIQPCETDELMSGCI